MSMTREDFLNRVRAALGRSRTIVPDTSPAVDESVVRLASVGDDLVTMFCQRATEVGMKVERVAMTGLRQRIIALLKEVGARRVVASIPWGGEVLAGVEVVDQPTFDEQFDIDTSVTDVHAALAESGTLICRADADHSRGPSLLPTYHIAVVRRSDILPDMLDYWAKTGQTLPGSTVFITGPSKTADIEGELITGVHGPGKVFVLVVEDA